MLGNSTDKTYIAENTTVAFTRRITAEYNMNYDYSIDEILDTASFYGTSEPGFFSRYFPMKDVVKGVRPTSGIWKPRWRNFGIHAAADPGDDNPNYDNYRFRDREWRNDVKNSCTVVSTDTYKLKPRTYLVSENHPFKYWESPYRISDPAFVDPFVTYPTTDSGIHGPWANKIVIKFNTALTKPSQFNVLIRNSAGAWSSPIATQATGSVNSQTGEFVIYRQSNGTWTTTESLDINNAIRIYGIKVEISQLVFSADGTTVDANGYPNIIEISPRVHIDITDRVSSWDAGMNLAESDSVLPVGTVSTNNGSVTLSNNDNALDEANHGGATLKLADVIRRNCRIVVAYTADTAGASSVPAATMYVNNVRVTGNKGAANLEVFDYSKFLQEEPCPEITLRTITPTAAIWTLLDLAGHNNVIIKHDGTAEPKINWYYASKEQTIWAAIQSICASHQYAVYVDESDNIVIMTRSYIYSDRTAGFVFNADATLADGGINYKTNVYELEEAKTEPVNSANIQFVPKYISSEADPDEDKILKSNQVAFQRTATRELFRPEQPVLLGCASLAKTIGVNDTTIRINSNSIRNSEWGNFAGYLMIDSEIMEFEGLQFAYTAKPGAPAGPRYAHNDAEFLEIRSYAQGVVTFTGYIKIKKRGAFGTTAASHVNKTTTGIPGWSFSKYSKIATEPSGNKHLSVYNKSGAAKRVTGAVKDLGGRWVNTRMMIVDNKSKTRSGGIVASVTSSGASITSGLYFQITQNDNSNKGTLSVYRINNNERANIPFVTVKVTVPENKYFDFSVHVKQNSTNEKVVTAYIDGDRVLWKRITTNVSLKTKMALVASGDALVRFDYVAGGNDLFDGVQAHFDGQIKKYVDGILKTDRDQVTTRYIPDLSSIGFERFDDYVREIYFRDLRWKLAPAISYSTVYTSLRVRDAMNKKYIALGNEIAGSTANETPFGCRLLVANVSSRPLVLANVTENGEILYPFIYGHVVQSYEQQRAENKDDASIFRIGEKKVDITPEWITNRVDADGLGKWIIERLADGAKTLTASVWVAHIVQIGDVVRVYAPDKQMSATTEKYVVVGASKSDDGLGLRTKFELVKL